MAPVGTEPVTPPETAENIFYKIRRKKTFQSNKLLYYIILIYFYLYHHSNKMFAIVL